VEIVTLPDLAGARLPAAQRDRVDCTFMDHSLWLDAGIYAAYAETVVAASRLRWMHLWASGVGHIPFVPGLDARGVVVTSSTGANAEPVAQTGFTGLMMLARGFPYYFEGQRRREWRPLRAAALPDDLRGQTVVIVGLGAIGSAFAGYARAFGLKVIGVRRSLLREGDPVDEMHTPDALHDVLPRADWLVLACPLTKPTRNLIDAAAFACLKPGARLINIARGAIVDEDAMIEALRSGRLAGAALDAHRVEPLPAASPLWDLPNVVITPKNATASNGNERRYADLFIANFQRWTRGEALVNVQHPSQEIE
jgi:phosphoglycerate dehydrogenase-like enzyme